MIILICILFLKKDCESGIPVEPFRAEVGEGVSIRDIFV